ncbi:hypothetical protein SANTM175S_01956 [Streptomyces antimycoticus]
MLFATGGLEDETKADLAGYRYRTNLCTPTDTQPFEDAGYEQKDESDRRILVGGVVLVQNTLADGLVELARGGAGAPAAFSASPAATASRVRRMAVFSSDLTALLRSRAFSFVLFRLIWDLMFAT